MKRFISVFLIIMFLFSSNVFGQAKIQEYYMNLEQVNLGVVGIQFSSNNTRKKVMIEKDNTRYIYNMTTNLENFPLQSGSGTYKISLLENKTGNAYKVAYTQTVKMESKNDKTVFLNSIQIIKWNNSKKVIAKADELTRNLKSDEEKIKAIYNYITSNIVYDYNKIDKLTSDYVPSIDDTFENNKGICYDYASLFAGMLRSIGIPAKLVKGYAPEIKEYHAWNEVYVESLGKWVTMDTTVDAQYTKNNINISAVKDSSQYTKVNEY